MRKITILVLTVFAFGCLSGNIQAWEDKDALQAIKKAVKENPHYSKGKEVKWFKLLVTDDNTRETKVKLTLPIAVIEMFLHACDDEDLRIANDYGRDIDVKKMFKELKQAGPMALIEIRDKGEVVKIWLE
jgi:hypothetical protein